MNHAEIKTNSMLGSLGRIWNLMGEDRPKMIRALIFRLLQSFALGLAYGTTLSVIHGLSQGEQMTSNWVLEITGIMVLSLGLQLLFSYLSVRDAWQVSFQITGRIRQDLLDRLRTLPLGFHLTRQKGDLVNTISADVVMIEQFLSDAMARIVQAFGLPLAVFVFMLTLDWRLAIAMVFTIVIALPIMSVTGRHLAQAGIIRQDQQAEASSRVIEYVLGMKVIRAFGQVAQGNARFQTAIDQFRDISIEMVNRFVVPIIIFIAVVMLGIAITFLATGWVLEDIETSVAITALVLAFAMYSPIIALISVTEMVRMAEVSLMRIDRVLCEEPMREPVHPKVPQGYAISANDVCFGYDTKQHVLRDISFNVPERSMTAIVGPSGAGKSTVLNLIARFWDVNGGQITLGDVPLTEMKSTTLIDQISFVFQDVYLFSGSIAANIRLGQPDASDLQVREAAKLARAHDFIEELPDGYEAEVGEGGMRLSGGEKQRIAIARAILKDAPVVLLDEATAAIDPINERAIQEALANLVADRTLIVVAHKLSTIETADQILVMQDGKIVERGTHDTLLANGQLYEKLYTQKTKAESWTISNQTRSKK